MKYTLIILFLLIITNVCAVCESGQIDINSASLSELDKLTGIGPVKAQAIIDSRPFDSVDDLIDVYGIGEITLQKIKEQGLACVDGEDTQELEENIQEEYGSIPLPIVEQNPSKNEINPDPSSKDYPEGRQPEVIKLHPQTIKGEDDSENPIKINYPMYGFMLFCILLGFLFIIKRNKFNKNEFR